MMMNYNTFITTEYNISSKRLPAVFDGFRAVVLADLHDCRIGGNYGILLQKIEQLSPDIILLAGDMITEKRRGTDHAAYQNAELLIRELTSLGPVYYGFGNHEERWQSWQGPEAYSFPEWLDLMSDLGVTVLDNSHALVFRGDERIRISGLNLPRRYFSKLRRVALTGADAEGFLGETDPGEYQILLAHTPAFVRGYMEWGADLALAGHYHGGVVRVPGIGGLIDTNFRLFPRYDHGCYRFPEGYMVVSAGLGCHTIPVRLNNPPELVSLVLHREEGSHGTHRL